MKQVIGLSLGVSLLILSAQLSAQSTKKEEKKAKAQAVAAPVNMVLVYLGNSDYHGGDISKNNFDSHLKQGLVGKDSLGNTFKVDGFNFSYAERNLYEDSVGNLMVVTDYVSEFCPGDTISPAVANNIFYKTKPGDTAYFDNIKVLLPDGRKLATKPMKFVLTK